MFCLQVFAEVHTHAHYYLVLAHNGSVLELPGLTNMDLSSVQQVCAVPLDIIFLVIGSTYFQGRHILALPCCTVCCELLLDIRCQLL
jgi:hypothetical protein